jgi:hypothetical protein
VQAAKRAKVLAALAAKKGNGKGKISGVGYGSGFEPGDGFVSGLEPGELEPETPRVTIVSFEAGPVPAGSEAGAGALNMEVGLGR